MKNRRLFYSATDDEIKRGKTTDIYFRRTKQILEARDINRKVVAEISCGSLPKNWNFAVLCGIEEAMNLLEGYPVDVSALPEGTIFKPKDINGVRNPIMNIKGNYKDFCELETPLLGLLCQATGISTSAARIKMIAMDKQILSFGVRRMHPAISPMIDRASYIGGFDGVSAVLSAKMIKIKPQGTMPHALIIMFENPEDAWRAFDEIIPMNISRIALCDTFSDEKMETINAAKTIKNLSAVRLDTPKSRRGNLKEIISEIRWELDIRGYNDVKIFISGGVDEELITQLKDSPVDGFGIGTYVSNSPTVDMAMNIVEIDGKPISKRGVFGGEKQLYKCFSCNEYLSIIDNISKKSYKCPICNKKMRPLLKKVIRNGKIVAKLPDASEIRNSVLKELYGLN